MYRTASPGQLSFEDFYLPFGGKLSGDNRWVKLAELIPWKEFEQEYADQFSKDMGAPAKRFRVALGALIIKERLGTSDRETVEQIRENPYLQYFLGMSEYSDEAPFDASMLVNFRQRIGMELALRVNESVVQESLETDQDLVEVDTENRSEGESDDDNDEDNGSGQSSANVNQGKLILDASCAPSDIRYPTDLGLLNEAREKSEEIIDDLYEQLQEQLKQKPRTYRRIARKEYLSVSKKRRPGKKLIRKGIRKQLGYLRRNLSHVIDLIAAGAKLSGLSKRLYRNLLVINEVLRQQQEMYDNKSHRIDHRIVSIAQPHVRPIVRGKAGAPVEFGAKFSASYVNGYVFLDHLSWENFNESGFLITQVELFRSRFGHYPSSVHADQIYRSQANLKWCKERGIRLSGPPLGRPSQDKQIQAQLKKQAREDEKVRVAIEGKFGQGKRRFSLARVMAKLAETAETAIAITFLVINLERRLRRWLSFIFGLWCRWIRDIAHYLMLQEDFEWLQRNLTNAVALV